MMVVYTIIILCILIFVHELGHFMAAKALGVGVNEFALGMGPVLFKKQKGETQYSLRLLPIGGFCAMEGEDEESENEKAFSGKPAWIKAIILFAGPLMNVIFAVLILAALFLYIGQPTTTIASVSPSSPAMEAGLLPGDKVMEISNVEIKSWTDIPPQINGTEGASLSIKIERPGSGVLTLTSSYELGEDGRKIIGIVPTFAHNPFTSVKLGCVVSVEIVKGMYETLGKLVTGQVSGGDLTGPVGIAYVVDDSVSKGFRVVCYLVALISLNLAIVNLLPFPALDGGRLLFLVIRKVFGKRLTADMEGKVHFIGILMLFGLMIYVTWNDIGRFILGGV